MRSPGFTADASLDGSKAYVTGGMHAPPGAGAGVVRPAQLTCRQALAQCRETCAGYSDPRFRQFCNGTCDFSFIACRIGTLGLG